MRKLSVSVCTFVLSFLIKCCDDSKKKLLKLEVHYDTLAADYSHSKHNYLIYRLKS